MKLIPLFALLLVGCASFGTKFDASKVDLLKPGETTERQIIEWFGQPMTTTIMATGNRKHGWVYGKVGFGSMQQNILETVVSTNGVLVDFNAKIDRPEPSSTETNSVAPTKSPKDGR